VGGIFCDLTKAFDCVDHDILISKIEKDGIIGKGKELFHSYIKDGYQRVLIDNKTNHNTAVLNRAVIKRLCTGSYTVSFIHKRFTCSHKQEGNTSFVC